MKVWFRFFEALEAMSVQELKLPSVFCWYCHLLIVPLPVTEAVMVSWPPPEPAATVGFPGFPGLVRKSSLASSFAFVQPLSLYAFQV